MNKLYPIGYTPKQLLINNDFQVNQRELKTYSTSPIAPLYTLDMWRLQASTGNGSVSLTVNDDKTITVLNQTGLNAYFVQVLADDLPMNDYTSAFEVVSKDGTVSFAINGVNTAQEVTVGRNIYSGNGIPSKVTFYLTAGSSITLKYVDLFEGNIACPHVKEDKAIALQKCQSRVIVYDEVMLPCIFSYNDKDYDGIVANLYLPTSFKGQPNINYDTKEMRSQHGGTTYTDFSIVSKKLYGANVIRIIWKKNSGVFPDTMKDIYVYMKNLLISCEPI